MKIFNRLLLVIFISLTLSNAAFSDNVQLLVGAPYDTPSASSTNYSIVFGNGGKVWNSSGLVTLNFQKFVVLGTISNLKVWLDTAPGGAGLRSANVWDNGTGNIRLSCTISGSEKYCEDPSSFAITSIRDFVFYTTPGNTPASSKMRWTIEFRPFTSGERLIASSHDADVTSGIKYFGLYGQATATASSAGGTYFPSSGNITAIYAAVDASQNSTAKGWIFTVQDNRGGGGSVQCTVSGATTTCSGTGTQAVGDANSSFSLKASPLGTPTSRRATVGYIFQSDNHNTFTIHSSVESGISTGTRYIVLSGGESSSSTTQNVRDTNLVNNLVFRKFAVRIQDVPGAGATRTFSIYKTTGGVDTLTPLTCTMNSATSTCSVNANVEFNSSDTYAIVSTVTGAPTTTGAAFGIEASFKRVMITK